MFTENFAIWNELTTTGFNVACRDRTVYDKESWIVSHITCDEAKEICKYIRSELRKAKEERA